MAQALMSFFQVRIASRFQTLCNDTLRDFADAGAVREANLVEELPKAC